MREETALKLIAALDRHAAAIEKVSGLNGMAGGGINIYHHGDPYQSPQAPPWYPTYQPTYLGGGS